jgi:hypothetical protein
MSFLQEIKIAEKSPQAGLKPAALVDDARIRRAKNHRKKYSLSRG